LEAAGGALGGASLCGGFLVAALHATSTLNSKLESLDMARL
jgi:hypothetical protein